MEPRDLAFRDNQCVTPELALKADTPVIYARYCSYFISRPGRKEPVFSVNCQCCPNRDTSYCAGQDHLITVYYSLPILVVRFRCWRLWWPRYGPGSRWRPRFPSEGWWAANRQRERKRDLGIWCLWRTRVPRGSRLFAGILGGVMYRRLATGRSRRALSRFRLSSNLSRSSQADNRQYCVVPPILPASRSLAIAPKPCILIRFLNPYTPGSVPFSRVPPALCCII